MQYYKYVKELKMDSSSVGTVNKKSILTKKTKDYIFVAAMLIIPVVHFIIFWGVVNFNSILLSFRDHVTGKLDTSFHYYKAIVNLYKTGGLKESLVNTFIMSGFRIVFLLPWGFFLTYFLFKKLPFTGVWRVCLFLPSILPAIFTTVAYKYLLQSGGPLGILWVKLIDPVKPNFLQDPRYAKWVVLVFYFLTNFGGQFILFTGAMSRIPEQILEAAQIDGAGMGTEIFKIVFPLCWPTFSMLLILNLSTIFTDAGPILFLTGGGADTRNIAFWIFEQVDGGGAGNLYQASAVGIVCTIITFPIVSLVRWASGKIFADVEF